MKLSETLALILNKRSRHNINRRTLVVESDIIEVKFCKTVCTFATLFTRLSHFHLKDLFPSGTCFKYDVGSPKTLLNELMPLDSFDVTLLKVYKLGS